MTAVSAPDQTELDINSFEQAQLILSRLPKDHQQLNFWLIWSDDVFKNMPWQTQLNQAMCIAYARMAVRNGSLSNKPRSYHNELHINDLLIRVMFCAAQFKQQLTPNGLAILSFFAACHDLRQGEPRNPDESASLVGSNEQASFIEAQRIIEITGERLLWNEHHLLLLKTMIEGSTFGSGGKKSKNFFQGNLARHLLDQLQLPNKNDEQLVLLGCDIDTANVSLSINEFAQTAVNIYHELITHQDAPITAFQFFSEQQKIYFFEQQKFNALISQNIFEPQKEKNKNKLIQLSDYISELNPLMDDEEIIQHFINKANELAYL